MDNRKGFTMLDPDTFTLTVAHRLAELDHPRHLIALAVEAIALRGVLDSITGLADYLDTVLDDADPDLTPPIREVLNAFRERVTVGMVTVTAVVARIDS